MGKVRARILEEFHGHCEKQKELKFVHIFLAVFWVMPHILRKVSDLQAPLGPPVRLSWGITITTLIPFWS